MKVNGFVKILSLMLCVVLLAAVLGVVPTNVSAAPDSGECVVIVQGYEEDGTDGERFATNTVNALETAFKNLPGGATVTVLRPGATGYKNKQELLNKLDEAVCSEKCTNVVMVFIGHGNTPSYGLVIGPNQTNDDYLFSDEVAKIIDKCKKKAKLYADCCYAGGFLDDIIKALKDKTLVQIALGSCGKSEEAVFWPDGDSNQYYIFSKCFLEDYYLIITDPNVMADIEKEAKAKNLPVAVVILHEAFKSAQKKTVQEASSKAKASQNPVEPVKPEADQGKVDIPGKPIIKIVVGEYSLHFYKVTDEKTNKCVVVGYVDTKLGLPIAPMESVSCKEDCSAAEFKFTVGDKTHTVKIKKEDSKYTVTIDGNTYTVKIGDEKADCRFDPIVIYLVKGGKKVALLNLYVKPGQAPGVFAWLCEKEGGEEKRTSTKVTNVKYDAKTSVLTFDVDIKGEKHSIKITFRAFGEKYIEDGDEKPYSHYLVRFYDMYSSDFLKIGELTMVSYDGQLEGAVWLESGDVSFPLTGSYDEETGLFDASAKTDGSTYFFSRFISDEILVTRWCLDECIESGYLVVSDAIPLLAFFIYSPEEPLVSEEITFDAYEYLDESVEAISYQWDFGDGMTASGSLVIHSYSTAGDYNVTLTIEYDEVWSTYSEVVSVSEPGISPWVWIGIGVGVVVILAAAFILWRRSSAKIT